ncbi:hypothetical protein [Actinophytocola algeriensis]|uniref:Uncharacterized protein n=1 Tax=Actinophytocola algeriensis TaxID=1768010 RepID=A0A7W7VCN3_9PSEU|nr:hypothetical protein [Actinophytocola algeriensis]MBB4905311.1 hypothetical protein [Actinophytocola algeriensis]MBE1473004.1 hypothetical protein [Actinophytocola algeriensis]
MSGWDLVELATDTGLSAEQVREALGGLVERRCPKWTSGSAR